MSESYIRGLRLFELLHRDLRQSLLCEGKQTAIHFRHIYQNNTVDDNFSLTHNIIGKYKTVILADDGVATGSTLIAAARWTKGKNLPIQLIIATSIAPKETLTRLKKETNHVEVITSPTTSSFKSVGQYYQSFEQVTDEQVIEIMRRRGLL